MMRAMILGMATLVAIGCTTAAEGGVIYNNLAAESYVPGSGPIISGPLSSVGEQSHSESFVAAATANLEKILIPICSVSGTNGFNLTLTDSSNNVLESWSGLIAPLFVQDYLFNVEAVSVSHSLLQSGHTYTLTATADG